MSFTNCYEDAIRAEAYAQLEFANTYHLAFRDLPQIVRECVSGTQAIDFGCVLGPLDETRSPRARWSQDVRTALWWIASMTLL